MCRIMPVAIISFASVISHHPTASDERGGKQVCLDCNGAAFTSNHPACFAGFDLANKLTKNHKPFHIYPAQITYVAAP